MAKLQTITLPKPWYSMQLMMLETRADTKTEVVYIEHLYLVDPRVEGGLRHLQSTQGGVFPREALQQVGASA